MRKYGIARRIIKLVLGVLGAFLIFVGTMVLLAFHQGYNKNAKRESEVYSINKLRIEHVRDQCQPLRPGEKAEVLIGTLESHGYAYKTTRHRCMPSYCLASEPSCLSDEEQLAWEKALDYGVTKHRIVFSVDNEKNRI